MGFGCLVFWMKDKMNGNLTEILRELEKTLQKFAIAPQEKMTKLGWKIYTNFFKVKQSEKLNMLSHKKKVPNSAKIMGECFAEFLFYGPARPGGP